MALEGTSLNTPRREADVRLRRDPAHAKTDRNNQAIPVLFRLKNLNSPPLTDAEKAAKALEEIAVAPKESSGRNAASIVKKPHQTPDTAAPSDRPKSNLEQALGQAVEQVVVKSTGHSGFRKVFLLAIVGLVAYFVVVNKRPTQNIAKNEDASSSLNADVHSAKVIASVTPPLEAPKLPSEHEIDSGTLSVPASDDSNWNASTSNDNSVAVETAMQNSGDGFQEFSATSNPNGSAEIVADTSAKSELTFPGSEALETNSVDVLDYQPTGGQAAFASNQPMTVPPRKGPQSNGTTNTDDEPLLPGHRIVENPWMKQAEIKSEQPARDDSLGMTQPANAAPKYIATDAPEIDTTQLYEMLSTYKNQTAVSNPTVSNSNSGGMQFASGPVSAPTGMNSQSNPNASFSVERQNGSMPRATSNGPQTNFAPGVIAPPRPGYGLPAGYAPPAAIGNTSQPVSPNPGQPSASPTPPRPYTPIYTEYADAPPEASLNVNAYPSRTGIAPRPSIPYQPISPTFQP